MFTNLSKIPIKLAILLVGFGLLVAGCDSAGTAGSGNDDSGQAAPLLKVTNDLKDRVTTFGGGESNSVTLNDPNVSAKFALKSLARVDPPSNYTVSHISQATSNDFVFVGYKTPDSNPQADDAAFGGGVDILNASDPAGAGFGLSDNALRSPDLDVQELAYSSNENLYIAGAVDFGNVPARDFGNSPATIVRANIDASSGEVETTGGDVEATEAAMPGNVTKSVDLNPNGDGVLAISDNTSVFSFGTNLNILDEKEVSGGVGSPELRSVSGYGSSSVFTFDTSLQTFTGTVNGSGSLSGLDRSSVFTPDPGEAAISRVTSADVSNHSNNVSNILHFVGLNEGQSEGGLRVFSQDGTSLVFSLDNSSTQEAYTGVTVDDDNGRVYAAGVGGSIDVFNITDQLGNGTVSTGLSMVGSFDASQLQGLSNVPDGQINQILFHDRGTSTDLLYVAASDAGVLAVEIDPNASDLF